MSVKRKQQKITTGMKVRDQRLTSKIKDQSSPGCWYQISGRSVQDSGRSSVELYLNETSIGDLHGMWRWMEWASLSSIMPWTTVKNQKPIVHSIPEIKDHNWQSICRSNGKRSVDSVRQARSDREYDWSTQEWPHSHSIVSDSQLSIACRLR